ncbi:MAG: hypothetical protein CK429_32495 [Mycobacterium sp.]|nr:MAG: hypothetical protein CK429_32495 [Mycobacterium sp.]
MDLHDPGDPAAHYWSLNTATADGGGVLTITRSEVRGRPHRLVVPARAMTAKNNVIVDLFCVRHGRR